MTRIGLLAALAVAAPAAHGQPQRADTPVPGPGAAESRIEPSGVLEQRPAPRLNQAAARPRSDVDARHCLELATNSQVHRCAEPFRTRSSQAPGKTTRN
jgi:hypothetical protein